MVVHDRRVATVRAVRWTTAAVAGGLGKAGLVSGRDHEGAHRGRAVTSGGTRGSGAPGPSSWSRCWPERRCWPPAAATGHPARRKRPATRRPWRSRRACAPTGSRASPTHRPTATSLSTEQKDHLNGALMPAAQKACQHLMPQGPPMTAAQQQKLTARALKFVACMRAHGLPTFADPDDQRAGRRDADAQRCRAQLGRAPQCTAGLPEADARRRALAGPVDSACPAAPFSTGFTSNSHAFCEMPRGCGHEDGQP